MEIDLDFYLKDWRQRAGLTQVQAAKELGMPVTTYRGIEQGRPFTYQRMMVLAVEELQSRRAKESA